jgi:ParB-like chromosome segregation protein Spo0J|nr:MAG TPA: ParB protein [Caudoviricetes sp.]
MKLADITPADYNPRVKLTQTDFQYKALKASIDEFGLVVPLIVNERTGTLVSGHQRLNVMLASGVEETEVVIVDFPPEKEKALCIAMNKVEGEWDYGKLADIIEELQDAGVNTLVTGFSNSEIKDLLGELEEEIEDEPDSNTEDEQEDGVTILIGEYKFQMDSKQYEDMIARVRLKVGFASAAVTKELKRRLIA